MPSPSDQVRARCAQCGGQCCRTRPGLEAPDRFLGSVDPAGALASALASGDWVLAEHLGVPWQDGRPPPDEERRRVIRTPRPATVAEREAGATLADAAPAPCVFLAADGCRLSYQERPRMCQSLEPDALGDCEAPWDRRAAALAWLPHQPLVAAALAVLGRGA